MHERYKTWLRFRIFVTKITIIIVLNWHVTRMPISCGPMWEQLREGKQI